MSKKRNSATAIASSQQTSGGEQQHQPIATISSPDDAAVVWHPGLAGALGGERRRAKKLAGSAGDELRYRGADQRIDRPPEQGADRAGAHGDARRRSPAR